MNEEARRAMSARLANLSAQDQAPREPVSLLAAMPTGPVEAGDGAWTKRLVLFLRAMAIISVLKGLSHWAQITGFIGGDDAAFEIQPTPWQTATVYFAVIELVAAVGLWLATPWGAVVWLTTIVSMAVIELMFPSIYGGSTWVIIVAMVLLAIYLALAWMAARERPP